MSREKYFLLLFLSQKVTKRQAKNICHAPLGNLALAPSRSKTHCVFAVFRYRFTKTLISQFTPAQLQFMAGQRTGRVLTL